MNSSNSLPRAVVARLPMHAVLSRRLFESFVLWLFRFYCPLRATGRENLPRTPFILCSNHASHIDSIALMGATGLRFQCFAMLAASDYFFRKPGGSRWFSGMVHLIPISRSAGSSSLNRTLSLCRAFLKESDGSLILFPEGTRSMDGEMKPFRRGISLISSALGLPVVPAYIEGSGAVMPKGRFFPAPGRITVHIGKPIYPQPDSNHDDVARTIEANVRSLKGGSGE